MYPQGAATTLSADLRFISAAAKPSLSLTEFELDEGLPSVSVDSEAAVISHNLLEFKFDEEESTTSTITVSQGSEFEFEEDAYVSSTINKKSKAHGATASSETQYAQVITEVTSTTYTILSSETDYNSMLS